MSGADFWLVPDALFDGQSLRSGYAVLVSGGTTVDLMPVAQVPDNAHRQIVAGVLTPGFVDLQVNGGGGVLLNQTPTVDGIQTIMDAHRKFGTVSLLPTVITDAPEIMEAAASAIIAARHLPGMLGLHIEGPHISVSKRGTHKAEFIRPFDDRTFNVVEKLRQSSIPVLITVAPEATNPAEVGRLARLGAVVSIGHSNATAEETQRLLDAGASCFTHLYNAMSPMQGRAPGVVGTALGSDAHIGVICDGIHVADEMVGLAYRACKSKQKMFLVSDAMPTVGGPSQFDLYGMTIRVQDNALVNSEGSLAGAHTTMAESVARLVSHVGLSLEDALHAGISSPAKLMQERRLAFILNRRLEDLVVLSSSGRLIECDVSGLTDDCR